MKSAAILTVLLLSLLAGVASGQPVEPVTDLVILEDASGDQELSSHDQPLPANGRFQNMDLRAARVSETEDGFTFTIEVASFEDVTPFLEWGHLFLRFEHHGQPYLLEFLTLISITAEGMEDGFNSARATLSRYDATEDRFLRVQETPSFLDSTSVTAQVPRALLLDPQGSIPFPGRTLTGFEAWTQAASDGFFYIEDGEPAVRGIDVHDRMPEDGPSSIEVPVTYGLQQDGHVRLASPEPMRASNGEATVFYYDLEARSLGPSDSYTPAAVNLPVGWEVRFDQHEIAVDAGATAPFRAQVTIPFAHKHGSTDTFLVELSSTSDPGTVGRTELGVHYLATPQPTGHHDTLYIHSTAYESFGGVDLNALVSGRGQPIGTGFFNTLDVDERSDGSAIYGRAPLFSVDVDKVADGAAWNWDLFLSPGLRMGLDFDMDAAGDWEFTFETLKPLPNAVVSGTLYLWPEGAANNFFRNIDDAIVIGTFDASEAQEVAANGHGTFTGTFTPAEAGDYVPYERGQRLMANIELTAEIPAVNTGADNVFLEPGGRFRLPLLEYADTVADASGFTIPDAVVEEAEAAFEPTVEEAKDTPVAGAGLVLLAVAFAGRRR